MKVSDSLISKLKEFEGCKLKAYKDAVGVWTIGCGHTKGVKAGQVITMEKAEELLKADLATFEKAVSKLLPTANQNQFDALVDFSYNVGVANLTASTLLRKIKQHATEQEICYQFSRWNRAGGKVLPGLVKRRAWEAARYFGKA